MAADEGSFITPPPFAVTQKAELPEAAPRVVAPADLIALPPGVADFATHKTERTVRPPVQKPEITFFPAAPGAPVVPVVAAPEVAPPGISAQPPAANIVAGVDASAPIWRLVLPDGHGLPLPAALYIGRNPAVAPESPAAELLPVADPRKSVSKTHALVETDAAGVWVTDLSSTNGTAIIEPDDSELVAEPGERTQVPAGGSIAFGDYVIRVEHG